MKTRDHESLLTCLKEKQGNYMHETPESGKTPHNMAIDRIVSFLPSATEIIFALDAQDKLCGVTHDCNYPNEARQKPRVIESVIDSETLSSKEIDIAMQKASDEKKPIFRLNENAIKLANPDLIISQDTCEVCAAHNDQVTQAIGILEKKPKILSMNPHNMRGIIQTVVELGDVLGRKGKAMQIAEELEKRIILVKGKNTINRTNVLAIEWIEPFFSAGHWIPEMIEAAGGINMASNAGEHSKRLDFQAISSSDPDMIILMPCGFDMHRTVSEYSKVLRDDGKWNELRAVRNNQVFAVDANSFFSKPSIRTVEGIEILAKIIQPERFQDIAVPEHAFSQIVR